MARGSSSFTYLIRLLLDMVCDTSPGRFALLAVWDNVYGFDMSSIKEIALLEPLVDTVPPTSINSNFCPILVRLCAVAFQALLCKAPFYAVLVEGHRHRL